MKHIGYYVLITVIGASVLAGICYAADFSADIISSAPEGTFKAKMYVSQDKSRTDVEGTSTIARMDKHIIWVLMKDQKMYMEQPLDVRTAVSVSDKVDGEISRTAEGREKINGMACTKYRVEFESRGIKTAIFQWIDDSHHVPVKTAAIDGSWSSEFKDIRIGPQDPALFEIPAGYKKFAVPTMDDISAMMRDAE
jgi:hypothetical protein